MKNSRFFGLLGPLSFWSGFNSFVLTRLFKSGVMHFITLVLSSEISLLNYIPRYLICSFFEVIEAIIDPSRVVIFPFRKTIDLLFRGLRFNPLSERLVSVCSVLLIVKWQNFEVKLDNTHFVHLYCKNV